MVLSNLSPLSDTSGSTFSYGLCMPKVSQPCGCMLLCSPASKTVPSFFSSVVEVGLSFELPIVRQACLSASGPEGAGQFRSMYARAFPLLILHQPGLESLMPPQ